MSVAYYQNTCAKLGEWTQKVLFLVLGLFPVGFSVFATKNFGLSVLLSVAGYSCSLFRHLVFGFQQQHKRFLRIWCPMWFSVFLLMLFSFRFLRLPSTCHDVIERNAWQTWMTLSSGCTSQIKLCLGPSPYKESQRVPGQKMAEKVENESQEVIVDCIAFLWRG